MAAASVSVMYPRYRKAVFRCVECGSERQYGNAPPSEHEVESGYNPLINCNGTCFKPTRHRFERFSQD